MFLVSSRSIGGFAALFAALAFVACSGTQPHDEDSERHADRASRASSSPYHGFALANDTDFWETDSLMCTAMRKMAEALVAGEQPDTSSIEGRHSITAGTHVSIKGHTSGYCPGSHVRTSMTIVTVQDDRSDVNGQDGYIIEGVLKKI